MPWKARSVVQERQRFVEQWLLNEKSTSELCREFGISRKTGYKIWKRFREGGLPALENWPQRPHRSPNRTPPELEQRVLDHRGRHQNWGPKKLGYVLECEGIKPPARSTIAAILKRHGLAHTPRARHRGVASSNLIVPKSANELWCIDFKGWFRTGNGMRCDPLTVLDSWSRYLLCCHGLFEGTNLAAVRAVFERLFEEYGLPSAILSDNGSPWASTSAGGLTQLSVWWLKLGILPLRIYPGCPQQNGRLERLHRTLKQETAMPAAMTAQGQQERFEAFRHEYNHLRPHEALGLVPPERFYEKSLRRPAGGWEGFEYPSRMMERRVYGTGQIRLGERYYSISKALGGETVALDFDEMTPRATIYLGNYVVGVLDLKKGKIAPPPRSIRLLRLGVPPTATVPPGQDQPATEQLQTRLSVLPMSLE